MDGEIIFLRMMDVGNSIDLKNVKKIFPTKRYKRIIKSKDTPSYVDFPEPLIIEFYPKI